MRWLIDEGMPKRLVQWLRDQGHDVLDVADSDLRGSSDGVLWRVAAEQQRLIVTRDIGFVPAQSPPLPVGAIVVRAPHWFEAEGLDLLVQNALAYLSLHSLVGCLTVIQPGRVRQRALRSVVDRPQETGDL